MRKFGIFLLSFITISSLGGLVYVLFLYSNQQTQFQQERTNWNNQASSYQASINAQRKSKNDIRAEWDKQLVANDELVTSVVALQDQIEIFLKTPNQGKALTDASLLVDTVLDKNSDLKVKTRDTVEQIYQRDNEDQANQANPDGIK